MMAPMRTRAPSSRLRARLAALALLLASGVAAAQVEPGPASVLVSADLRRSPGDRADVVGSVSAGDAVEVLEVRGDQAKVAAGNERGWMPIEKLGARGEPPAADAGGRTFLGALGGALAGTGRGRADASRSGTVGIRGLQGEDLANAAPDPRAVERLEDWRASPQDGLAYGDGAGLRSRDVAYVEARR